ncbi:DUF3055 domain-containing protein [Brevibacillus sp. SYP-B805]|uniref:DUF3055 domain-containing protein n=1 Tax=Brevibacillus sp. SYP-B805 TaxID=1578199 RepID=UPI0013EA6281|nr:DUF3055 domain-containing protein [Brevibacillus sp. SYP-B805]NGQ93650.1 DUF3055 domain-containing protein [Brevibacillus sp. SYP-B805]
MERYDNLYDVTETAQVRFIGLASAETRHDFGIVFTQRFYGKPLVICLQTGQSTLLSSEDEIDPQFLLKRFRLQSLEEAEALAQYLREHLPSMPFADQY